MHNGPSGSPPSYMFPTPQAPTHAHYTPSGFSLRSPPVDHGTVYIHAGPSTSSASHSAPTQISHPYASQGLDPLALYPVPVASYGPSGHKTQQGATNWATAATTTTSSAMAITIPRYDCPDSSSGRSSRNGGDADGSGSDGGRDPTPPPAARPRAKDVKKKIHACMMCHKSFDRPSTLKKHLLVHTGEKAFSCESCGRRFGVASNLNRHAKTCRVAHAASSSSSAGRAPASSASESGTPAASGVEARATSASDAGESAAAVADDAPAASSTSNANPVPRRAPRKRKSDGEDPSVPDASSERQQQPRPRKRARRAPSPERWVPDSLKTFDLTPMAKSTPVPLPPVTPFQDSYNQVLEERNSFDENTSVNPYHPRGWKGRLPGPGLMGNNVANRSGGQLLIF